MFILSNKIIFTADTSIGNVAAETDDEFLFKCFVDHPAFAAIKDMNNSKMFLLGGTGTGKTAFLKMIEKNEKARFIELFDLSMSYLSNSDTIQFLRKIDVDISFFLQALWRHVICIELIKLSTRIEDEEDTKNFLQRFFYRGKIDPQTRKFQEFIEKNQNNFWITIDETIIEIASSLENNLNAELGAEIKKASGRAGYARSLSEEKKSQFQQRAKKFVNPTLLVELSKVISAIGKHLSEQNDHYYLLIDGLDDHWVEPEIKNTIIHALFEACKGLRKIRNLKVIVSIRNDVYEKMNLEYPPSQVQLEKNEDYIVRIKWTKDQLWDLVNKRIGHLFRWKYIKANVHFYDVFKTAYNSKSKTWPHILERTLLRPRDVIKYINACFQVSEGKTEISKTNFGNAEKNYSDDRLEALISEWKPIFGGIEVLLDLLTNKPKYFGVSELCHSKIVEELALALANREISNGDPIWRLLDEATKVQTRIEPIDVAAEIFHRLHLVGVVGLKLSSGSSWHWMHETHKAVSKKSISSDTKVAIHPMLWRAFESRMTDNQTA